MGYITPGKDRLHTMPSEYMALFADFLKTPHYRGYAFKEGFVSWDFGVRIQCWAIFESADGGRVQFSSDVERECYKDADGDVTYGPWISKKEKEKTVIAGMTTIVFFNSENPADAQHWLSPAYRNAEAIRRNAARAEESERANTRQPAPLDCC